MAFLFRWRPSIWATARFMKILKFASGRREENEKKSSSKVRVSQTFFLSSKFNIVICPQKPKRKTGKENFRSKSRNSSEQEVHFHSWKQKVDLW